MWVVVIMIIVLVVGAEHEVKLLNCAASSSLTSVKHPAFTAVTIFITQPSRREAPRQSDVESIDRFLREQGSEYVFKQISF